MTKGTKIINTLNVEVLDNSGDVIRKGDTLLHKGCKILTVAIGSVGYVTKKAKDRAMVVWADTGYNGWYNTADLEAVAE